MILVEPSLRPTTSAVLKHPLFWSKDKCLTYLQDVSDRVDKESTDSYILTSIERNRMEIVKGRLIFVFSYWLCSQGNRFDMLFYLILWNPLESFGILWNPLDSLGILWNS